MNYFNTALTYLFGDSGTLFAIEKMQKNNRPKLKREPKFIKDNFSTINRLEQYGYKKIKLFFLNYAYDWIFQPKTRGAIGIFLAALQQHRHGTATIFLL